LGDDASARETFFFIMPFLNWICEPFFLPVDGGFSERQPEEEMGGIARFITLKQEEGVTVSLAPVRGGSLSQDEASRYFRFCIQIIRLVAARDDIHGCVSTGFCHGQHSLYRACHGFRGFLWNRQI
jgi:hypothetical protein